LEDAYALAVKLRDTLGSIASAAEESLNVEHAASGADVPRLTEIADLADDLTSQISNQCTALRGS
jgi:hypothetical protein